MKFALFFPVRRVEDRVGICWVSFISLVHHHLLNFHPWLHEAEIPVDI